MSDQGENESQLVVRKNYEDVFQLAADVQEDVVIHRANCKVCKSPNRKDAEEYWDQKKGNAAAVVRFLSDRGEIISDKAVANHMREHYEPQKKMLAVKAYAEKLKPFASVKSDRLNDFAILRAGLLREYMILGEKGDAMSGVERLKCSEMQIKLSAQLVALSEAERKHHEEWKPAKIIVEKLQQIINVQLISAPDAAKPVLARVVEELFDGLEGVKIDK